MDQSDLAKPSSNAIPSEMAGSEFRPASDFRAAPEFRASSEFRPTPSIDQAATESILSHTHPLPESSPKPIHVRRPNWTTSEDEQLCRSWLENSLDPITNTLQKGTQFWHRVADDFATRGPGHIERNKDHVRNRWQLLQAKVIKFTSCYARIQSLHPTDKAHDEIVADAMRLYEREESHKFTFYSSWLILRNSPRWLQWSANVGHRRLSSGLHSVSDIAVSPHSTVSLLDSDESPTLEQPLNRLLLRKQKMNPASYGAEDEHVDRLMAIAMKRKADVQEAALEVQLLAIDPDKITDPLRKEVYMMKMEEIRDRYKAKRSKPIEGGPSKPSIQNDLTVSYQSPQP